MKKKTYHENINTLSLRDPIIAKLIEKHGIIELPLSNDMFASLIKIIIGQQLSNNVSSRILNRLSLLSYGHIKPKIMLNITDNELRSIGVSRAKVRCIKKVSEKMEHGNLDLNILGDQDDNTVAETLMNIKGIGPWTVEMFLIFALGRMDVFPRRDASLKNALTKIFSNRINLKDENDISEISRPWRPYRTIACLYIWKEAGYRINF